MASFHDLTLRLSVRISHAISVPIRQECGVRPRAMQNAKQRPAAIAPFVVQPDVRFRDTRYWLPRTVPMPVNIFRNARVFRINQIDGVLGFFPGIDDTIVRGYTSLRACWLRLPDTQGSFTTTSPSAVKPTQAIKCPLSRPLMRLLTIRRTRTGSPARQQRSQSSSSENIIVQQVA